MFVRGRNIVTCVIFYVIIKIYLFYIPTLVLHIFGYYSYTHTYTHVKAYRMAPITLPSGWRGNWLLYATQDLSLIFISQLPTDLGEHNSSGQMYQQIWSADVVWSNLNSMQFSTAKLFEHIFFHDVTSACTTHTSMWKGGLTSPVDYLHTQKKLLAYAKNAISVPYISRNKAPWQSLYGCRTVLHYFICMTIFASATFCINWFTCREWCHQVAF